MSATLYTDDKDTDEKTYQLEKLDYSWKIGGIAQTGITGPSLDYLHTLVTLPAHAIGGAVRFIFIPKKGRNAGKRISFFKNDPFFIRFFKIRAFTAISLSHMTIKPLFYWDYIAERQGFEPWETVKAQRFLKASI